MGNYTQNVYVPDWQRSKTIIVSSPGAGGHFFSGIIQKHVYHVEANSICNSKTNDWDSPINDYVAPVHLEGLFPYREHPHRLFTKQIYRDIVQQLKDKTVIVVMGKQHTPLLDVLAKWKRCQRGPEHWSDNGWRRLHNRARNNFQLETEDIKHNKHYEFFVQQCQSKVKNLHVVDYHDLFIDINLEVLNQLDIVSACPDIIKYISHNTEIIHNLDLTS